jgi:endogenous inhibitor of DNA gyrase (YacG/DUF329 family)
MSPRACPICKTEPPKPPYAPFCSKRCADIDLNRWFAGVYAVPAVEPADDVDVSHPGAEDPA